MVYAKQGLIPSFTNTPAKLNQLTAETWKYVIFYINIFNALNTHSH